MARAHRFFVDGMHEVGKRVPIDGEDAHKIVNVLRMHSGDIITVCDSWAGEFEATLDIKNSRVRAKLGRKIPVEEPQIPASCLTVAQGVPKGQKMDFVVEKLTEFGVATVVPLFSERTIADVTPAKIERWRRLAKTAAQQTGRCDIPAIEKPANFRDFLARSSSFDRVLIPWELAERAPLRDTLPPLLENVRNLAIVIGPEGGFSHAEIDTARAAGAIPISLGQRILRTESAALALVAVINYLGER